MIIFKDLTFHAVSGYRGKVQPAISADIYVAITSSCQELPDLEQLHDADPEKPMIFFNLKLESQRGDLGLPVFPSKDLHYRFLSKIKPVYLLRTRQYALTLTKPPFVLNYQGALFRCYPGGYQCLLDSGRSRYRRVTTTRERPALGEFKDIITDALDVDTNAALIAMRKGITSKTWWEMEKDFDKEASPDWRM